VIETIRFPIEGMTCTSCVSRITRALRKLDGVERVKVDLGHESAVIRRQPSLASNATITAAVAAAGYEADLEAAVVLPTIERPSVVARFLARVRP
jgi:P-type Cu+ transporter